MKRSKAFSNIIDSKRKSDLSVMDQIKKRQKELQDDKRKALDDLELKLEKHQENAQLKQQQIYKEKDWKNKLKNMRFMDMEENKKHLQRVTAIKVGAILEKHHTALEKLRAKSIKIDGFIKENT